MRQKKICNCALPRKFLARVITGGVLSSPENCCTFSRYSPLLARSFVHRACLLSVSSGDLSPFSLPFAGSNFISSQEVFKQSYVPSFATTACASLRLIVREKNCKYTTEDAVHLYNTLIYETYLSIDIEGEKVKRGERKKKRKERNVKKKKENKTRRVRAEDRNPKKRSERVESG